MARLKRWLPIVAVALVVVFILGIAWVGENRNRRLYMEGLAAENAGDWQGAHAVWTRLGEYRDCSTRKAVSACHIALADSTKALQKGNYDLAARLLIVWEPGDAVERDRLPALLAKKVDKLLTQAQGKAMEQRQRERLQNARAARRDADAAMRKRDWATAVSGYELAAQLDPKLKEAVAHNLRQARAGLQTQRGREKAAAERTRLRQTAAEMNTWDSGTGSVALAVTGAKMATTAGEYYARGNNRFVKVCAAVSNRGAEITHVNPNDFTLETPDGFTVSHDTSTYSLSNYFDAVNLRPGGQTSGWLIFYLPKEREYTLNYQGFSGTAQKRIAFP